MGWTGHRLGFLDQCLRCASLAIGWSLLPKAWAGLNFSWAGHELYWAGHGPCGLGHRLIVAGHGLGVSGQVPGCPWAEWPCTRLAISSDRHGLGWR
jgi:hypothetical protein